MTDTEHPFITIAGRRIGADYPPYVVAEMSANHDGALQDALKIVEAAKASGADAVKLQTYTAETITLDCERDEFMITDGLWAGRTLHQLYREAHLPWEWHAPLFERARQIGLTIFSSPFDRTAVDFLGRLDVPAYKIASFEAVDLPLISYAAATGKPLILSTGMADADEIAEAVSAARQAGCTQLALLHCVSGYPAPPEDYNLRVIPDIIRRFQAVTGLSDHTLHNATAIASVAVGASVIEKHVTLDRGRGGPDDSFSLEPAELASLCRDVKTAWSALGRVDYGRQSSERANVKFRRSLYFVQDIAAGDVITAAAIRSVRPGYGAAPKLLNDLVGKRVLCDVQANTPVTLDKIGG